MRAYVVSRLAQTALVVFLSLTAVFLMVRLSGDVAMLRPIAGTRPRGESEEEDAEKKAKKVTKDKAEIFGSDESD